MVSRHTGKYPADHLDRNEIAKTREPFKKIKKLGLDEIASRFIHYSSSLYMDNSFRDNASSNSTNNLTSANSTHANDLNVSNPLQKPMNQFAEKAVEYKEQATAEAKEVVDTLHDKKDQVVDQLQKAHRHATLYARENPWPLIGAAALAGLLTGLLLGHCSPDKNCSKHRD